MQKWIQVAGIAPILILSACGSNSTFNDHSADKTQKPSVSGQHQSQRQNGFVKVKTYLFKDDGTIPNNPYFQVLIYPGVFKGRGGQIVNTFKKNNWGNNWVDGVFPYHHFHSTSHEVLGVISGHATLKIGEEKGKELKVSAGNVLVLPAGTGHKRLSASNDFSIAGGYPNGQDYDTQTKETPAFKKNISKVGKPAQDPVYGDRGSLLTIWRNK
ncbi:cupin domain-containing protein [Sporolactobacillus shoreicorticis]|uniref:Cupin domain-containing protein n=1 Tax=Sporolactobacillus shoreicorticis TaxID=1923877 RepID=A0ABW5S4B5_9BACL|nr:cupin domain-containing protein [Sporolactobacillus shoreicorticis]MCO7125822.1 cupin domain-containing protein [Sporolactobacillus shoreicorticis]